MLFFHQSGDRRWSRNGEDGLAKALSTSVTSDNGQAGSDRKNVMDGTGRSQSDIEKNTRIELTTECVVYGMGVDLGTVLSLMGTVWTGNPLSLNPSFSIGGPSNKVFNLGENLLGLGLLGESNAWLSTSHGHGQVRAFHRGQTLSRKMDAKRREEFMSSVVASVAWRPALHPVHSTLK